MISSDILRKFCESQKLILQQTPSIAATPLLPGALIRVTDDSAVSNKSDSFKKPCVIQFLDKNYTLKSTTTTASVESSESSKPNNKQSKKIYTIPPTACIENLSDTPRRWYVHFFDIPTTCESFRDWIISQREQFNRQVLTSGFRSAILLIKAIKQLHENNAFLVDSSITDSIFVAKDSSFRIFQVKHASQVQFDRSLVFSKYIASLKRVDPFDAAAAFLYPPELLESAVAVSDEIAVTSFKRKTKSDIWAFGVLFLLILGCHESEITQIIDSKLFPRVLSSSKQNDQLQNLLVSIFDKSPSNRPSLFEVAKELRRIASASNAITNKRKTSKKQSDDHTITEEKKESETINNEHNDFYDEDDPHHQRHSRDGFSDDEFSEISDSDDMPPAKVATANLLSSTIPPAPEGILPIIPKAPNLLDGDLKPKGPHSMTPKESMKKLDRMFRNWNLEEATDLLNKIQNSRELTEAELTIFSQILYNRSMFPQAMTQLKKAVTMNEFNSECLYLLGLIYFQRKQFDESLEYFRRSYSANVLQLDSLFMQGELLLLEKKDVKSAIRIFEQCLMDTKNQLNPRLLYRLALAYKKECRFKDALHLLEKISSYRKEFAQEYKTVLKSTIDSRITSVKLAISTTGASEELLLDLANSLKQKKQFKEALEILNDILLSSSSSDVSKVNVRLWLEFGECYLEQNNFIGAIDALQDAIKAWIIIEEESIATPLVRPILSTGGSPTDSTKDSRSTSVVTSSVDDEIKFRICATLAKAYSMRQIREKAIFFYQKSLMYTKQFHSKNRQLGYLLEIAKPFVDSKFNSFEKFESDISSTSSSSTTMSTATSSMLASSATTTASASMATTTTTTLAISSKSTSKLNQFTFSVEKDQEISKICELYCSSMTKGENLAALFRCCGLRSIRAGDHSTAISCFRTALALEPGNLSYSFDLAAAQAERGQHKFARLIFNDINKRIRLNLIRSSQKQYLTKKQQRTLNNLKHILLDASLVQLSYSPSSTIPMSSMYFNLSLLESNKNNNNEEVFRLSKLCLEIDAKNADCWCNLARIFAKLNLFESATECMETCYSIDKYHLNMRQIERDFVISMPETTTTTTSTATIVESSSSTTLPHSKPFVTHSLENLNLLFEESLAFKQSLQELYDRNYEGALRWLAVCLTANPRNFQIKQISRKVTCIKENPKLASTFRDSLKAMHVLSVLDQLNISGYEIKQNPIMESIAAIKSKNDNENIQYITSALFNYIESTPNEFSDALEQLASWSAHFKNTYESFILGDYVNAVAEMTQHVSKTPSSLAYLAFANILRIANIQNHVQKQLECLRSAFHLIKVEQVNLKFNLRIQLASLILSNTDDSQAFTIAEAKSHVDSLNEQLMESSSFFSLKSNPTDLNEFEKSQREQICLQLAVLNLNLLDFPKAAYFTSIYLDLAPKGLLSQFLDSFIRMRASTGFIQQHIEKLAIVSQRILSLKIKVPEGLSRYMNCILFKQNHQKCLGFCLFQAAVKSIKVKKHVEAIDLLTRASAAAPKFIPFMLTQTELLLLEEKNTKAQEKAMLIMEIEPNHLDALRFASKACTNKSRYSEAIPFIRQFFAQSSNILTTTTEEAENKMNGKYIKEIIKAIQERSESTAAEINAVTEEEVEELSLSEKISNSSSNNNSNVSKGISNNVLEMLLLAGECVEGLGDIDSAIEIFEECIELNPTNLEARLEIANMYYTKCDYEGSLASVVECLRLNSNHSNSNFLYGNLMLKKNAPADALKAFRRCASLSPNHQLAFGCIGDCILLIDSNDFDQAESAYRKQIKVNAKHVRSYLQIGHALLKKKNQREAAAMFNSALQCTNNDQRDFCYEQVVSVLRSSNSFEKLIKILKSQSADFPETGLRNQLEIASIYWKQKKYSECITISQKCLREYPEIPSEQLASIYYSIACAYNLLSDNVLEEESLLQALAHNSNLYEAYFRLSKLNFQTINYDVALKQAKLGLALNENAEIQYICGVIYKSQKCFEESLAAFSKALEIVHFQCNEFNNIYLHLGEVYSELSLFEEASECYKVNLSLDKKNQFFHEIYAISLFKLSKYQSVIDVLAESALVLANKINTSEIVYILGESHYALKSYDAAMSSFTQIYTDVHTKSTEFFMPCIDRLLLYVISRSQLNTMRPVLQSHIEKIPTLPEMKQKNKAHAYYTLALLCFYQQDMKVAQINLDLALQFDPMMENSLAKICIARQLILGEASENYLELAAAKLAETPEESRSIEVNPFYTIVDWEIKLKSKQFNKLEVYLAETCLPPNAIPYMSTFYLHMKARVMLAKDPTFESIDSLIESTQHSTEMTSECHKLMMNVLGFLEKETFVEIELLLAYVNVRLNNTNQAIKHLEKIDTLTQFHFEGLIALAKLKAHLKTYSVGIAYVNRVIVHQPMNLQAHNELARLLRFENRHAEALISLERSISIDPKYPNTFKLLALVNASMKKHMQSIEAAERYLEFDPANTEVLEVLAEEYFFTKSYSKARSVVRGLLNKNPGNVSILQLLGNIHSAENNLESLRTIFDQLSGGTPPETLFLTLGTWAKKLKDFHNANAFFVKYLSTNPGNVKCLEELLIMNMELSQKDEFKTTLATYAAVKFEKVDLLISIGEFFIYECSEYAVALKWLEKIKHETLTNSPKAQFLCAVIHFCQKDMNKANIFIQKSMKIIESPGYIEAIKNTSNEKEGISTPKSLVKQSEVIFLYAAIAQARGDPSEKIYNKIKRISPEERSLNLDLILAEFELERNNIEAAQAILASDKCQVIEDANKPQRLLLLEVSIQSAMFNSLEPEKKLSKEIKQAHLEQIEKILLTCLKNNKDQCEYSLISLAINSLEQGQSELAKTRFNEAIAIANLPLNSFYSKPMSFAMKITWLNQLAETELEKGQADQALNFVKQILSLQSNNLAAIHLAARIESTLPQHHQSAANRLNSLIVQNQQTFETYFIFGSLRQKQNQLDSALMHFKKCILYDPLNTEVNLLIAQITEKLYKYSDANESYQKLLENDPNNVQYLKKLAAVLFSSEKYDPLDQIIERYAQLQPNLDFDTLILQARSLNRRNRFTEALACYLKVREAFPENITTNILLAISAIYLALKDYKNEIIIYTEMIESKQFEKSRDLLRRIRLSLANAHAFAGDFPSAQRVLIGMNENESDPINLKPDALANLAIFFIAEAKFKQALKFLNRALVIEPANRHALCYLGFLYSKTNEITSAISAYSRCCIAHPSFIPSAINLAILQRSSASKNITTATKTLFTIQEIHPKNLLINYHVALTYIVAKSPSQAARVLQEAIAEYPERLKATQASLNSLAGEFNNAFKASFTRFYETDIIESDENPSKTDENEDEITQKFTLQKQHSKVKKLPEELEQIAVYNQKDSSYPDLITLNLFLAQCLRRSKQYFSAIQHLKACISADPSNFYYAYSLALTFYLDGELFDAQTQIIRCKDLDPAHSAEYCFAFSNMLHNSNDRFHNYLNEELRTLHECLTLKSNFALAYLNIGYLRMQQGEHDLALKAFKQFVALRPNAPEGYYNLGNSLLQTGQRQQAIESFEKCLKLDPNHYNCNYNLAVIHMVEQRVQPAIDCFEKCFKLNPDAKDTYIRKLDYLYKIRILSN